MKGNEHYIVLSRISFPLAKILSFPWVKEKLSNKKLTKKKELKSYEIRMRLVITIFFSVEK